MYYGACIRMDMLVNKDRFQLRHANKVYSVGIGIKKYPTPIGLFRIYAKECDPIDAEVGTRCMYFHRQEDSKNRYPPGSYRKLAIHGIEKPESVGTPCTLGCVAMSNADVEELYDLIYLGDKLLIFADGEDWSA